MGAQHTPGPWPTPTLGNAGNWMIGNMPPIAGAVKEADAHLCSAAPELFEAAEIGLVALVEERAALVESHCLLRDGKPDEATLEEDVKPEIERLDKAIAFVSAALAKACGEA